MAAELAFDRARLWRMFDLSELRPGALSDYLEMRLTELADWFGASGGSIFLEDGDAQFRLCATVGDAHLMPRDAVLLASNGYAADAIESGEPRIVDLVRDGYFSSMVIPLIPPGGSAIGVLNLNRSEPPAFGRAELDQAQALAAHISLIVANAKALDGLGHANERLSAILNAVGAAVVLAGPDGEILESNAEAARLLGGAEDMDGFLASTNPALSAAVNKAIDRGFAIGRCESGDRDWTVRCESLSDGSKAISVQETTEVERARRSMGRLRRMAEIGRMTAAIAHEIRNPLTGISSAAKMIVDRPEEGAEFASIVIEETAKLDTLCSEFLEFARPIELNREQCALRAVLERVVEMERPEFDSKLVALRLLIEGEEPIIRLDTRRAEQAVRNVVRNAREACEPGGSVVVCGSGSRVTVRDDGQGMDNSTLDRLFSPFNTTKAYGTGLGLCVARKILDAHGGDVKVKSAPGRGSTFVLDFGVAA